MKRLDFEKTSPDVAGRKATADFSVTGATEPGVFGNSGRTDALDKSVKGTRLHNDIDINFALSGTTDNPSFGASTDLGMKPRARTPCFARTCVRFRRLRYIDSRR